MLAQVTAESVVIDSLRHGIGLLPYDGSYDDVPACLPATLQVIFTSFSESSLDGNARVLNTTRF